MRAIYGSVQLKSDPYCDGVIIPATIPELTLGSVLYNIAGKNEDVLKFLGPSKARVSKTQRSNSLLESMVLN